MPLYFAVEVRLAELIVASDTHAPSGSWLAGWNASSVVSSRAAQSTALAYSSSCSASHLQVCGSNGSGSGLMVVPSSLTA